MGWENGEEKLSAETSPYTPTCLPADTSICRGRAGCIRGQREQITEEAEVPAPLKLGQDGIK